MFTSNTESRKLSYNLRFPNPQNEAYIEREIITPLFPDEDTRIMIAMEMSLREFTVISSCIDVGRDIAYNEDSDKVYVLWQEMVRSMTICDEVANCILNSQSVRDALSTYLSENNRYGSTPNKEQSLPDSILDQNLVPSGALCTDANKYAIARAVVQEFDRLTNDFLEVIEILTNPNEVAAKMIANIPIFGDAVASVLEVADWMLDNVKETYAAAYNPTTELDYSCAVYCAFDGCSLSFSDIVNAYYTQGEISPPTDTDFATVMQWLIGIVASTDNLVVGSMHVFIMLCMEYGSSFFGSGVFTTLQMEIEDASDEEVSVPSECECDNTWTIEYDFTAGNGGWLQQEGGNRGQYSSGVGWISSWSGATEGIIIYKMLGVDTEVLQVTMEYEFAGGGTRNIASQLRDDQNSGSGQVVVFNSTGVSTTPNCVHGVLGNYTHRDYLVVSCDDSDIQTRESTITKIKIKGRGAIPTDYTDIDIVMGCP